MCSSVPAGGWRLPARGGGRGPEAWKLELGRDGLRPAFSINQLARPMVASVELVIQALMMTRVIELSVLKGAVLSPLLQGGKLGTLLRARWLPGEVATVLDHAPSSLALMPIVAEVETPP
ncbi:unnamed protein product [Calypogeia fissa]